MSLLTWRENLVEEENRNKLAKAEEGYQQQLSRLIAFENDGTHWSGTGERLNVVEENLEETLRRELAQGEEISAGTYGTVRKVLYRKVTLAAKEMKLKWLSSDQIEQLKQEAFIGQRLDSHIHVIKHVGTYYHGYNTADCRLHILTFPVAVCDLGQFLDDCEEIIQPRRNRLHEFMSIGERLVALGFHVSKEKTGLKVEIQSRLHQILGCLTEAIEWMHVNNVRHRDLKPANILLRPGQVLLTDFGISRHRISGETTSTETDVGFTWGYAAPEVLKRDGIGSLAKTDVYSLGCVFLHILTVIHGPNVDSGNLPPTSPEPRNRHHLREQLFRVYLDLAPVRHGSPDFPHHQFIPPAFVTLLAYMLGKDSDTRPSMTRVNRNLRKFCGENEWLYGVCCRRGAQPTATAKKTEESQTPEPLGKDNDADPGAIKSWLKDTTQRGPTQEPPANQLWWKNGSSPKQTEDGIPVTIPTHRTIKYSDSTLFRDSHQSQLSLLSGYFEGGKGNIVETRRPSATMKVTPSSRNRSSDKLGDELGDAPPAWSHKAATKASTLRERKQDDAASMVLRLGLSGFLQAEEQHTRGAQEDGDSPKNEPMETGVTSFAYSASNSHDETAMETKEPKRGKKDARANEAAASAISANDTVTSIAGRRTISENTDIKEGQKDRPHRNDLYDNDDDTAASQRLCKRYHNLTVVKDTIKDYRKELTTYAVYKISPCVNEDRKDKDKKFSEKSVLVGLWTKALIIEQFFSQDDIAATIKRLERNESVTKKMEKLGPNQRTQISGVLYEKLMSDCDIRFEWVITQLHRSCSVFPSGKKYTTSIDVYLKRAPKADVDCSEILRRRSPNTLQQAQDAV